MVYDEAFFTNALANYPDTSDDTFYRQCATYSTYIPNWTVEKPDFYGQAADSPSNSLNQGYLTIAYTNGGTPRASSASSRWGSSGASFTFTLPA